jgi:subtilisin family serine protease
MPNVSPGRPFDLVGGDSYPLPRPADRTAAELQRSGLLGSVSSRRRKHLAINTRLIQRRLRPGGLLKSTGARLKQVIDETGQPLLTLDEIVVRTADLDGRDDVYRVASMRDLLRNYNFTEDPVEQLDARVTLLSNPKLTTGELALAVEELRLAGYQASLNQVEPLGAYVTKGDPRETGPEPTERRPVRPPEQGSPTRPIKVAVIDTGFSTQARSDRWLDGITPDEADIDPLYEVVGAGEDGLGEFDYCAGHGTFVAGVVRQVAPTADLLVRRAIGQDGIGVDVDVAIAMLEAFDAGADIINLSLGTETPHDQPPVATMVALEIIGERLAADSERDVVVVAAAGNNATSRPVFPAAFSGMPQLGVPVVAVAGLSVDLEPADFSSRGFWITCSTTAECVLAPFVRGRETQEIDRHAPDVFTGENPWAVWSGTSFATPQISGAIARRCQEHDERPSDALAWLLTQGPKVPDYGTVLEILPARSEESSS